MVGLKSPLIEISGGFLFIFVPSVIQPIFIYPVMEQNINRGHQNPRKVFKGKTEFTISPIDYSTPETIAKTTEKREADKTDRHFNQRMLRAYLKGQEFFNFGFTRNTFNQLVPVKHKVLFSYE